MCVSPFCPPTLTVGLRELDSLVELDLTDNMLTKHSSLEPFQNLHHLSAVSSTCINTMLRLSL